MCCRRRLGNYRHDEAVGGAQPVVQATPRKTPELRSITLPAVRPTRQSYGMYALKINQYLLGLCTFTAKGKEHDKTRKSSRSRYVWPAARRRVLVHEAAIIVATVSALHVSAIISIKYSITSRYNALHFGGMTGGVTVLPAHLARQNAFGPDRTAFLTFSSPHCQSRNPILEMLQRA